MSEHVSGPAEQAGHAALAAPVHPAEPPLPIVIPSNWGPTALVVGALALAGAAALGFLHPPTFFRAYLPAYLFVLGISLGSLALSMVGYLTGGGWARILTPIFQSTTTLLPVLALLFLPLLLPVVLHNDWLFPWADPDKVKASEVIQRKLFYLNPIFFVVRVAIYFSVWIGVAWLFWAKVRRVARTGDIEDDRSMRMFAAVGLGLYGLTITFAAVDWGMSLEPEWYSTIYGVLLAVGEMLSAFSFAVFIAMNVIRRSGRRAPERVLRDCANLMLAFTMLWAYMAFSQFLLIYSGNLKEEIPWYLKRSEHGWQFVALAVAVLQFGVPFFSLLTDDVKLHPQRLAAVAGLAFVMRLLDLVWFILPAFEGDTMNLWWMTPLTVVGLTGIWGGLFLRTLASRSLDLHPYPEEEEAHA